MTLPRAPLRAAAVAFLVSVLAGLLAASPALDGLAGLSLDVLTALRWRVFGNAHPPAASPAVVVAIDEETFRTPPFAGTPTVTWTRELGRVLTALIDGGAAIVGFDVVFPTSIEQSELPFGDDTAHETLGARLRGFDRDFLRALALGARANKVVLGETQHQDTPLLPAPGQRAAVGFGRNIRPLNIYNDTDDIARRVPLSFVVDGASVPSMAVELATRARGARGESGAPLSPKLMHAGAVPGTITLNFAGGAGDIPTFGFADLHACVEKHDTDFFRRHFAGKVVLIGTVLDVEDRKITSKRFATAPEGARAARCALPAPASGQAFARDAIAGVYVHATAVNNLLRHDPVTEPGRAATGLFAFALAGLAAAAALRFGPAAAVGIFLALTALWTAGATVAFRDALALPLLAPPVAALACLGAMIGWRLVVSDRSLRQEIARRRAHEAEMASAAAIQRAMLPAAQPAELAAAGFDVFPFITPAREVGGDLYDIVRLAHVPAKWAPVRRQEHAQTKESTRVLISIGDVCGKGIPAALFMAMTQSVMRMAVRLGQDLQAEVGAANDVLSADNAEGMFTTLFCAVLDLATGTLAWCNCGHPPALVLRRGADTFEPLRTCGPPLGVVEGATYKATGAVTLAPGDALFLYTDGVSEAENRKGDLFGSARLEAALRETRGQPARAVVEHVVRRVTGFANGAPQSDDITCVAVVRSA
jgi:serine phosphatase RsbU (regulator of sigma subunit)/CHASE2 domain-containing sensor protein